jgi:polyisoprenoid-binding protein YceI
VKLRGKHGTWIPLKVTGGDFVLDMTSMVVSGPPENDEKSNNKLLTHLKSPDFFEVSAHPIATFVITSVAPFSGTAKDTTDPRQESISKYKVANPTHTVSGNLTIKGITKNIEFPASIVVSNNSANAIAKFNVDRTQWNIVYPGKPDDLIRNDIHFGISLKAGK